MKDNEKVYFEEYGTTGGGCYDDKKCRIILSIYVRPTGDGHAFHYNAKGELYEFAWANPSKAKMFYAKNLPEELRISIQYGTNSAEVLYDKRHSWTLEDLEYDIVNLKEITAYKKVLKELKNVNTIEDFKELYPLIKEGNRIDMQIMRKLFKLVGLKEIEVHNGEMGMAFYENFTLFNATLSNLNIP